MQECNKSRVGLVHNPLVLIFLFLGFYLPQVHAAEDRPLRSVPPKTPVVHSLYTASCSLPHTLITEDALQQPLTQRYIAQYTSPGGIKYLNSVMELAAIYMPFIREEIACRNLPAELAFLPVIESGFQITARSSSGAVGLWQFMMNSISAFGIKVNDFVDERSDFIKSTRGALQKLEDNYNTLGCWELALAAYNSGLGEITRTVQRTKIRDYWELSRRGELKQETEHYLPKLIAVSYILSQPRRFGIDVWHKPINWVTVPLERQVSLDILAQETGIESKLLHRLNAQLLLGISPVDSNFHLIIPTTHLKEVVNVLEREDLKLIRYYQHIAHQGDTLWSISRHYGTSVDIIEQYNPGILNRYLKIGEIVIIPAFNDVPPTARPAVKQTFNGSHVVVKGETLWSLSRRYGLDPQDLAQANGMTINQILHEGRTLKVPILE